MISALEGTKDPQEAILVRKSLYRRALACQSLGGAEDLTRALFDVDQLLAVEPENMAAIALRKDILEKERVLLQQQERARPDTASDQESSPSEPKEDDIKEGEGRLGADEVELQVEMLRVKAMDYIRDCKYDEALLILTEALALQKSSSKSDPSKEVALLHLQATVKSSSGDPLGAALAYTNILDIDPRNVKALMRRAGLYEKQVGDGSPTVL